MKFEELGLAAEIVQAVHNAGYTTPTPIQAQAIPAILSGRDVIGIAQTGTGKTAGFTLPMIHRLMAGRARARMPRTLILEPTRELASQVAENFDTYGAQSQLTKALLIGGVSYEPQEAAIERGADVLIATPGRLLDHANNGNVLLLGTEILVIDEADRMLDMGFIPDIERIVKLLPLRRQTLFFSATMSRDIDRISQGFLNNPERIEVSRPASTNANVQQWRVNAAPRTKRTTLLKLIKQQKVKNAIIFCNRKREIDPLVTALTHEKYDAVALHGDMTQPTRLAMLDRFRNNEAQFLVASDVAARGLDIPAVSHVINFDTPSDAEDYVHRIGRTGRAGKAGTAITLATREDGKYIDAIEALIGKKISLYDAALASTPAALASEHETKSALAPTTLVPTTQVPATQAPATLVPTGSTAKAPQEVFDVPTTGGAPALEARVEITDEKQRYRTIKALVRNAPTAPIIVLSKDITQIKKLMTPLRTHAKPRAFHENMLDKQKQETLDKYRSGAVKILVATPSLIAESTLFAPYVINCDMPQNAEEYRQRLAACSADAVMICLSTADDGTALESIEISREKALTIMEVPQAPRKRRQKPDAASESKGDSEKNESPRPARQTRGRKAKNKDNESTDTSHNHGNNLLNHRRDDNPSTKTETTAELAAKAAKIKSAFGKRLPVFMLVEFPDAPMADAAPVAPVAPAIPVAPAAEPDSSTFG